MLNEIVSGISEKLYEAFGGGYEIYEGEVRQGLAAPCFIIAFTEQPKDTFIGQCSRFRNYFSVTYMPDGPEANSERLNVMDKLPTILEYITTGGRLLRGTEMIGHIEDGALVFFVCYNTVTRDGIEAEPMEALSLTKIKTKG